MKTERCARSREFESRTDGINCVLSSPRRETRTRAREGSLAIITRGFLSHPILRFAKDSFDSRITRLSIKPTARRFCVGPHRPPILPPSTPLRLLRLPWNNGRIICSGAVPPGLKGSSEFIEQPLTLRYHPILWPHGFGCFLNFFTLSHRPLARLPDVFFLECCPSFSRDTRDRTQMLTKVTQREPRSVAWHDRHSENKALSAVTL